MDNQIREAFDAIQAPDRLKRTTKAALRKKTFDYGRNVLQLRARRRQLAAGLLTLVLVLIVAGIIMVAKELHDEWEDWRK